MSLPRAVTHTVPPFFEVTTRTGLQPAVTVDTTACAGSAGAAGYQAAHSPGQQMYGNVWCMIGYEYPRGNFSHRSFGTGRDERDAGARPGRHRP